MLALAAMADVLEILIAERDRLNRAIAAFQGEGAPKRRGRPPGSKTKKKPEKKRGRRKMSAAQKEAVSARMKKYWDDRRKAKK